MFALTPRAASVPRAARAMSTIVRSELPPVLRRAMLYGEYGSTTSNPAAH
jgi:hypothetical protein